MVPWLATLLPAAGLVATTWPAATVLLLRAAPTRTVRFRPVSSVRASAWGKPLTCGTDVYRPALTYQATSTEASTTATAPSTQKMRRLNSRPASSGSPSRRRPRRPRRR